MGTKEVLPTFVGGPNVKIKRTVLPVHGDLQDHDIIAYELLISKTWDQHDYIVQIAEEFGFEFMDEEKYYGIKYDYYFKFFNHKTTK